MKQSGVLIEIFVVQLIIIAVLIAVLFYAIKARRYFNLERKFNKYSVTPLTNKEISFGDRVVNLFNRLIKKISSFISKSKVLSDYGKRYEKHISFDSLETTSGIDFISIKFLLGFITVILYIITLAFHSTGLSAYGMIGCFLVGFFIIDIFIYFIYNRKRKHISDDLLKAIIIMNNSFMSGASIMQAVEIVKNELDGAIGDEFKKIYLDMTYGLTIEVVFKRFYERVKLEDVKFIATSLTLLNKTGGNIVKVFKSIEREFVDKKKLNDELKTVTAASIFVYRFLLAVPFVICFLIYILNPSYFSPMMHNPLGIAVLVAIVVLYAIYVVVIKKVMKVNQYE